KLAAAEAAWAARHYNTTWPAAAGALSPDEAAAAADAVWRQRSPVSGQRLSATRFALRLVRWRPDRPSRPTNLVLLTDAEAGALAAAGARALEGGGGANTAAGRAAAFRGAAVAAFGEDAVARIEARLQWAAARGWL